MHQSNSLSQKTRSMVYSEAIHGCANTAGCQRLTLPKQGPAGEYLFCVSAGREYFCVTPIK